MELALGPGGAWFQIRVSRLCVVVLTAYYLGWLEPERRGLQRVLRDPWVGIPSVAQLRPLASSVADSVLLVVSAVRAAWDGVVGAAV